MCPSSEREPTNVRERLRGGSRYGLVLALAAASLVFQLNSSASDLVRFLTIVLQAATLVAAVRTTGEHRASVRWASVAAAIAAVLSLLAWLVAGELPKAPAAIVSGLLVGVAPAVLAVGLVRDLQRTRGVTAQTLAGVLAIYLLAGTMFAFAYSAIDAVDASAMFAGPGDTTASDALYFSFVTLCTVGYGDLVPVSSVARTFAVVEMLIGQIYLVTIVSLIVANLRPSRS
jgi:Ion channel